VLYSIIIPESDLFPSSTHLNAQGSIQCMLLLKVQSINQTHSHHILSGFNFRGWGTSHHTTALQLPELLLTAPSRLIYLVMRKEFFTTSLVWPWCVVDICWHFFTQPTPMSWNPFIFGHSINVPMSYFCIMRIIASFCVCCVCVCRLMLIHDILWWYSLTVVIYHWLLFINISIIFMSHLPSSRYLYWGEEGDG